MRISLQDDEIVFLCGLNGTIASAKALGNLYYLETQEEEIVLFTEHDDLIVASSFGTGEKVQRGLRCTIFQLRELRSPLIVLPKGHPASPRLRIVVSIGSKTTLSCKIQPGTHPEQDVLCGSEEFEGLELLAKSGGVMVNGFRRERGRVLVEKL